MNRGVLVFVLQTSQSTRRHVALFYFIYLFIYFIFFDVFDFFQGMKMIATLVSTGIDEVGQIHGLRKDRHKSVASKPFCIRDSVLRRALCFRGSTYGSFYSHCHSDFANE
jgi:hypothetical protein